MVDNKLFRINKLKYNAKRYPQVNEYNEYVESNMYLRTLVNASGMTLLIEDIFLIESIF